MPCCHPRPECWCCARNTRCQRISKACFTCSSRRDAQRRSWRHRSQCRHPDTAKATSENERTKCNSKTSRNAQNASKIDFHAARAREQTADQSEFERGEVVIGLVLVLRALRRRVLQARAAQRENVNRSNGKHGAIRAQGIRNQGYVGYKHSLSIKQALTRK